MNQVGLDYLGSQAWIAHDRADGCIETRAISLNLPTALLPVMKTETLIAGAAAESHRRGRGLEWPPEAQVPVMGNPANDSGRVLMAAAFEKLARAEATWGKLANTRFTWRPDGIHAVDVDASRLIAAQVASQTTSGASVALVVPDSLGVGGQTALISAFGGRKVILVPLSVSVALAWGRSGAAALYLQDARTEHPGYLTILDLSLGRWCVARVPMCKLRARGRQWLVPVHLPKLKRTDLQVSGFSILAAGRDDYASKVLAPGWKRAELSGKVNLEPRPQDQRIFGGWPESLGVLAGKDDLSAALDEITMAEQRLKADAIYGKCLGVLVTGALSRISVGGEPIAIRLGRRLGRTVVAFSEAAAAEGAAHAAAGVNTDLPTWLETIEPLEIHFLGKDSFGDVESDWKEILPQQQIKAGTEYRSPAPIRGLKLEAGRMTVKLTVRRPEETGRYLYRSIESTQGKVARSDIPVDIHVIARPGQGFAQVRIESREPGLFESRLDWGRMEECTEPKLPPLGYIPRAVVLRGSLLLWDAAEVELTALHEALTERRNAVRVEVIARNAVRKLARMVATLPLNPSSAGQIGGSIFVLDSPMGRLATPPRQSGAKLLDLVSRRTAEWMDGNARAEKAVDWLRKMLGWWHLGCPRPVVDQVLQQIRWQPAGASDIDLHIAGLCFSNDDEVSAFCAAFVGVIAETSRPNLWLKALRNIVKFNEHALANISGVLVQAIFEKTIGRMAGAILDSRPQIAMHSAEALLFLLKRRRYDPSFVEPGSKLYKRALAQVESGAVNPGLRRKAKLQEVLSSLQKFLEVKAEIGDVGTLLLDDDSEGDGNEE